MTKKLVRDRPILEKPRNEKDHANMLKMLRDQRVHKCFTTVVALPPREDAGDSGYNTETLYKRQRLCLRRR
jgi:predicted house-cleaning NTP pyrophosphatase (Maf/HAM1 superfamily)